jgi:hypothetical protein
MFYYKNCITEWTQYKNSLKFIAKYHFCPYPFFPSPLGLFTLLLISGVLDCRPPVQFWLLPGGGGGAGADFPLNPNSVILSHHSITT